MAARQVKCGKVDTEQGVQGVHDNKWSGERAGLRCGRPVCITALVICDWKVRGPVLA